LASFPNQYYEAKLRFEKVEMYVNGILTPLKSPADYTYPKDIEKAKMSGISDFAQAKEKYMDLWMEKVYTNVWNTFNVNYKTIDNTWVETMAQTDAANYLSSEDVHVYLNRYLKEMKENQTIVECDKVALDSSSVYYKGSFYYFRCYVHYRIKSTKTKTRYTDDEFDGKVWGPYNRILYSRSSYVNLENYKINEWVDGVFDVGFSTGMTGDPGSLFGVADSDWSPYLYRVIERN